ncbi:transaldolase family protein [Yoonia sp. GPGPB17]|uniref:transaldolase family protein n=1 Tax=Yoonia sp. GPGPB17 TaxID=3026147 RepID=UPI0030BA38D7
MCRCLGAFLISPFVGRITDWFKKAEGVTDYVADDDPGVKSVQEIFRYYKQHDIRTIVMGASFRNTDQIKALAGCDRLTISPGLLDELARDDSTVARALSGEHEAPSCHRALAETEFRWGLNQNAMATEKLADGIRGFERDHLTLLSMLSAKI